MILRLPEFRVTAIISHSINRSLKMVVSLIMEDKMGRACGMHGRDEKLIYNFGWKT
jgi:hypothetical protein